MILTSVGAVIIVLLAVSNGCSNTFEQISAEKLQMLLQEKEDSIIFCTQALCGGCAEIQKDLKKISVEHNRNIYTVEMDSQSIKELLYQYGLNQVPAIIYISCGQINVYKGDLTEENIERILFTEDIVYERFNGIVEIGYDSFIEKLDSNIDFFVYFNSKSCSDCQKFFKILTQYEKKRSNAGVYFVDLEKIKNEVSSMEYEKILEDQHIEWVPYMLHIKNGVVLSSYEYPELTYRHSANNGSITSEAALAFFDWMDNELK